MACEFNETKYAFDVVCNTKELENFLEKNVYTPVISRFIKHFIKFSQEATFQVDHTDKFIDISGYKDLLFFYDNAVYYKGHRHISKRLWEKFKYDYLYPIVTNTLNKIQGYNIDFYRENPLEDSFNIAFNRFIQNEHKEIRKLLGTVIKYIETIDTKMKITVFKETVRSPNCRCYSASLHDIRTRFNKYFDKTITLYSVTRIIKYIFLTNYEKDMTKRRTNCVKETYMAISGFHLSNAISLTKYANKITKHLREACEGNVSIFKNPSLLLDDTKTKTYTSYNQVLERFNYIYDMIREMSRVSEYKNIDTFIDVDSLYKHNEKMNSIHGDLCVAINNYNEKYLESGLKDQVLINRVYDEIRYKIQRFLDTLEFENKNNFVYTIKEILDHPRMSESDLETKELLKGIYEKYGENEDTLINDTDYFINKAYNCCIEIIRLFISASQTISGFVFNKLYMNALNEINFDVITDVKDRINSKTSISNVLLINKSNSFRDFFISFM